MICVVAQVHNYQLQRSAPRALLRNLDYLNFISCTGVGDRDNTCRRWSDQFVYTTLVGYTDYRLQAPLEPGLDVHSMRGT